MAGGAQCRSDLVAHHLEKLFWRVGNPRAHQHLVAEIGVGPVIPQSANGVRRDRALLDVQPGQRGNRAKPHALEIGQRQSARSAHHVT